MALCIIVFCSSLLNVLCTCNFSQFLPHDMVDLWIVHRGGLTLDLSLGFLLLFDVTRPLGFLLGGSFHFMNSRMFNIGQFAKRTFSSS